jgi:multicomponent Na+:H+ antiporter subunit E
MRALSGRTLLFAALWLVLTEGDLRSPVLAVVAIAAGVAASIVAIPVGGAPARFARRPSAVLRFAAFFVRESVRGGIDVARRSLDPRLPIRPGYLDYPARLPEGPGLAMFAGTVSLLPGTLSTRLEGNLLRVHVLDRTMPAEEMLRQLEDRIGDLFGIPAREAAGGPGNGARESP